MKIGFYVIWTCKVQEDTVYCLCVCRHNKAIFMHGPGRRPMVTALWVWLQLFHYREQSRPVHPCSDCSASSGNVCCLCLTNLLSSPPHRPCLPHRRYPNLLCQKSQLNSKPKLCYTRNSDSLWGRACVIGPSPALHSRRIWACMPVFLLFVYVPSEF